MPTAGRATGDTPTKRDLLARSAVTPGFGGGALIGIGRHTRKTWMTQAQVAHYLQVTDRAVRLMIADGRLTGYKMGGRRTVRLRRDEVENLLQPIPAASG
jgi:excisionase family DNA binding protein